MRRTEISYNAELKELEKLQKRLERQQQALAKAEAKAEKFNVKDWDRETYNEWLKTIETEGGWIVKKEDQDKNGAYFRLISARFDLNETTKDLEKTEARLQKKLAAFEKDTEEQKKLEITTRDTEGLTLEEEKKIWAADGITLEDRYWGITPKGQKFYIYRNSIGYSERSLHCYTLRIGKNTIFTSGLFWRAYTVVKNS